ncbi:MAG: AraC family transcriptional regulator [Clostridium sp.]|jgi:AraC-like DNA-binding protein|nr:AraC family transcriptional regulator [Clostridium sp.]
MKPKKSLYSPPEQEYPVETGCLRLPKPPLPEDPAESPTDGDGWRQDGLEILLVQSGQLDVRTPQKAFLLRSGQGIFLSRGQFPELCPANGQETLLHFLRFHPSFLFGHIGTSLSLKYLIPLITSPQLACLPLDPDQDTHALLLSTVRQIWETDQNRPAAYELEVKELLCRFFRLLLPLAEESQVPVREPGLEKALHTFLYDDSRIRQAIRFIEEHYMDTLSLEDISNSIHLSKSECCRCFRRSLGITPFEYLTKYRIFESIRRIQARSMEKESISDLAFSVGFNSASYYSKLFRKYVHCTPLEYRRRNSIRREPYAELAQARGDGFRTQE